MANTARAQQRPAELAALPALGVGLGYRPLYAKDLLGPEPAAGVDFLEITIEHYLEPTPAKRRELDALRARYTLIPHGLNLSLGSAEGLDEAYLEQIAALIAELDPPWWSEHICFTRADGYEIGHLAPLPFSDEALDVLEFNLAQVRRAIPTPLILENITYTHTLGGELSEAEFLSQLMRRSDCGLLLDVTNLYINSVNHGFDALGLLEALPLERVVQLHFVGGHDESGSHDHQPRLIDSHSSPTPEAIWDLIEAVLARAPVKGAILERDENLPPFAELSSELARARLIGRRYRRWP